MPLRTQLSLLSRNFFFAKAKIFSHGMALQLQAALKMQCMPNSSILSCTTLLRWTDSWSRKRAMSSAKCCRLSPSKNYKNFGIFTDLQKSSTYSTPLQNEMQTMTAIHLLLCCRRSIAKGSFGRLQHLFQCTLAENVTSSQQMMVKPLLRH